jgi:hypothetical protein
MISEVAHISIMETQVREQQVRDAIAAAVSRERKPIPSEKLAALSAAAVGLGRPLLQSEIDLILHS